MFQIGEFSKIGQVSARQLRRYDEMGLLKPQQVDRFTGYRYYSAEQLPRLNRILALKELGLSLSQIGQYLNQEISTDELRGMLALKQSQIEQQLQAEAARLRYIASRIEQIDRHGVLDNDEVVLKSVPPHRGRWTASHRHTPLPWQRHKLDQAKQFPALAIHVQGQHQAHLNGANDQAA